MTDLQSKTQELLKVFITTKAGSQGEAARQLKGVSTATISKIMNSNFEKISDNMLQSIIAQLEVGSGAWQYVETAVKHDIDTLLADAQEFQNVYWIVSDAGSGKTTSASLYKQNHRNVFILQCSEDMTKNEFCIQLADATGVQNARGCTMNEIMDKIAARLKCLECPLIILDEADKLRETVLANYIITIYNMTNDFCGLVMLSTSYGQKRIERGLRLNKKGFAEVWSRIGRKFLEPKANSRADIYAICSANGVSDEKEINSMCIEVEECDFDLRRCEKIVHRYHRTR